MKTIQKMLLLIGLTILAAAHVQAADDEAVKKDLAQLQGEWTMVSGTNDGSALPEEMLSSGKRVCKGDELTVTIGGEVIMTAKITIDPSKKPKTMDFEIKDGPAKGRKRLGIYELNGDTYKSCFGAPGGERPAEFVSTSGDGRTVTMWKRAKK